MEEAVKLLVSGKCWVEQYLERAGLEKLDRDIRDKAALK